MDRPGERPQDWLTGRLTGWFGNDERFLCGSKEGEYLADVARDDPAYLLGLLPEATGDRDTALIRSRLAQRYLKKAQVAAQAMQTVLRRAPEDPRITDPLCRATGIMTSLCSYLSAEEKRLRDELEAIR